MVCIVRRLCITVFILLIIGIFMTGTVSATYTFTVTNKLYKQSIVLIYKIDDFNAYFSKVIHEGGSYTLEFQNELEYFLTLETNVSNVYLVFEHNVIKQTNYTRNVTMDDVINAIFVTKESYPLDFYVYKFKQFQDYKVYRNIITIPFPEYLYYEFYLQLYFITYQRKNLYVSVYNEYTNSKMISYRFINVIYSEPFVNHFDLFVDVYMFYNTYKTKMMFLIVGAQSRFIIKVDSIIFSSVDNGTTEKIVYHTIDYATCDVYVYHNQTHIAVYDPNKNVTVVFDKETFVKVNIAVNFSKMTKIDPYMHIYVPPTSNPRLETIVEIETKYYSFSINNNTIFDYEPESQILFYNDSNKSLNVVDLNAYFIKYNSTTLQIDDVIYIIEHSSATSRVHDTSHFNLTYFSKNLIYSVNFSNISNYIQTQYNVSEHDISLMEYIINFDLDKFVLDLFASNSLLSTIITTVVFTIIVIVSYLATADPLIVLYETSMLNAIFYYLLNANLLSLSINVLLTIAIIVKMLRDYMYKHQQN